MMHGTWVEIAFFLLMVYITSANTESCPKLGLSVENVPSCPKDGGEWRARAERKQCSRYQQCLNVGEFFYHCVINFGGNKALEICAPKIHIVGKRCVEFNRRGAIIQPSLSIKCEDCPNSYNSTDAYKYQECYNGIIKHSTELPKISTTDQEVNSQTSSPFFSYLQENSTNYVSSAWKIVAIVMITINVVLLVLMLSYWLIRKHQENIQKANRNTKSEGLPLIENPESEKQENIQKANRNTKSESTPFIANQGGKGSEGWGRYVAAIDIGDTYLNMALSNPPYPADVQLLGSFERMYFYVDPKSKEPFFGDEALQKYDKKTEANEKPQELRHIKLSDANTTDSEYNDALSWIMKRANFQVSKRTTNVSPSAIFYVFVVPDYWENPAIDKLKKKISEIKMHPKEQCCVIKRELTLSPFIHEVKARVVCLNFDVDNLVLQPLSESTTYAILHIGSSHYDLRFVAVQKDENNRKINGGESKPKAWEPHTLPSDCVLNFFEHIYEGNAIQNWRDTCSREYNSFLRRCETLIKNADETASNDQEYTLEFSEEILKDFSTEPTDTIRRKIEEKINEMEESGIKLGKNNWTYILKLDWIKNRFDGIKSQVSAMLTEKGRQELENKKVKCIIMTGAFSKRKIIWNIAETEWFKETKFTIVVPEDMHVFAMGGAYYGQKREWPNEKKS